MSRIMCVLAVTAPLLTGCASVGLGTDGEAGAFECAGWAPILIGRSDTLTDPTARAILAHNEYGRRRGCW